MSLLFLISFLFSLLLSNPSPSLSQQNHSFSSSDFPWLPTQNRILLSPNRDFAAGFMQIPSSSNHYTFSIWYYNISGNRTTVWSAKTNSTIDRTSSLVISNTSELRLINSAGGTLWPEPAAIGNPNSTLVLKDEGNLVYGTWQSFDYPTDTILPNQTLKAKNGTAMQSKNDKFIFQNSKILVFNSSEYWNIDNAFQKLDENGRVLQDNGATLVSSDFGEPNRLRRLTLDNDGNLRIYSFGSEAGEWEVVWQAVQEMCTVHGTCGPNAICMNDASNSDPTSCVCPPGFRKRANDNNSCEIKIPLRNPGNTKFLQLDYVNFSGSSDQSNLNVKNFSMCQSRCLANPNCLGFGFKYDGKGSCVLQIDRLLYGYWSPGTESAFFLRVDKSETDRSNFTGMTSLLETTCPVNIRLPLPPDESNTTTRNIVIICTLFAAELISGVLFFWAFLKKYIKYRDMARTFGLEFLPAGGPKRFTFAELKAATNDFSNLIGKGGFGDVYKGELTDHRVVAVKCLKNVTGGDAEFWAEVTIIARMHHLNLVRLWGFCAEKGQRILVYEYVPNGSLDKYLFPASRVPSLDKEVEMDPIGTDVPNPILDWNIRYRIALGVARAIAYLHEECLEWVLHCDIKPENILLGDDFCPKISDFGLAKLRKKEDMVSMSRIRGTRGYMAPEWVKMDPITPKADVYSFGMVLLELVSGVRNFEMQGSLMDSEDWYFPRWAFDKVFKEMKVEDILDRQIKHFYDSRLHFDLVDRMVKTAIWCLQDRPEARPSMGKVAKMLEGTVEITEPKEPKIFYLVDG
ncbi:PREDICTED: G-type lectin S-receptor-like serine/threonine-protein kinase At1g34300 [Theobroma cacao]|uniref:Receptor-like serine/threonine-protein kinase n=1 Tax=Theobroma cacao TaxID=3641 RepID=A0AB32VHH4_THECC|nr:PREDICTED: G-type lectin S-receptor-like serine/threonine-protein kinase At1g34300 [Theobroma cacao]